MNEKENYPGMWQGEIPEELKLVIRGEANMTINLVSCLEYMEHLAWPVFKTLDGLKVLDPACGTGEVLLIMAAKYHNVSFSVWDNCGEALALARQYAEGMELKNISFLEGIPETGDYDFILTTRPLQSIDEPVGFLDKLRVNLAPEGLMLIRAYTGSQPEKNLYLQEDVAAMKEGQLGEKEASKLVEDLLAQPLQDHIDGLRECNKMMEKTGFGFLSGLHPRSYEPASYLQNPETALFINSLSPLDRAYLAEQFCGQMLMHTMLYSHESYHPEKPSFYDSQASKYIPHLSPFVGASKQEERYIVGLKHEHLLMEKGIEFEDLSLPEELFHILQIIDGKINCEQVHRRFLPMPWERFWVLMQACWEEEIIYLHRP